MKLTGKQAGDVIIATIGPINGRNYNTRGLAGAPAPEVVITVVGTGSVQLQENVNRDFGNTITNTIEPGMKAADAGWVDVGTPVDATTSPATIPVTADDRFKALRLVVVTPGDADVVYAPNWWK